MAKVQRDIRAFATLCSIPAVYMEPDGTTQSPVCCTCCKVLARLGEDICPQLHARAAQFAHSLGETYLFSCHAGLFHAITPSGEEGYVLTGPFGLDEADPWQIPDRIGHTEIAEGDLREMRESLLHMRILRTDEATELCVLLNDLFSDTDASESDDMHRRAAQQRRIAETIHRQKQREAYSARYPLEKEDALIRYVREGDSRRADAVLNELLGYAFFSSGSIEEIRACTAELCSLLSRTAIEGGAESAETVQENRELLRALWRAESIEDVCYIMQEAVERFCESAFSHRRTGEQECIQRAIRYIHLHYAEELTLADLAREAHLSTSYFSTLFKKKSGYGFREYLSKVRIDRARELLEKTGMGVTEIAEATGFDTQSYFSRVFHAHTGLSPSAYRERPQEGAPDTFPL